MSAIFSPPGALWINHNVHILVIIDNNYYKNFYSYLLYSDEVWINYNVHSLVIIDNYNSFYSNLVKIGSDTIFFIL